MLIAATSKGICRLTFDDSEASLQAAVPQCDDRRRTTGGLQGTGRRRARGDRAAARRARPADRRRRHRLPGSGVARASQDPAPARRAAMREIAAAIGQPKAVRAVGTANGDNHVSRAHPLPPRDPQRRLARRLWRRPRPQEEAARVGRPQRSQSRSCRSPNKRLPPSPCSLNRRSNGRGDEWNRSKRR